MSLSYCIFHGLEYSLENLLSTLPTESDSSVLLGITTHSTGSGSVELCCWNETRRMKVDRLHVEQKLVFEKRETRDVTKKSFFQRQETESTQEEWHLGMPPQQVTVILISTLTKAARSLQHVRHLYQPRIQGTAFHRKIFDDWAEVNWIAFQNWWKTITNGATRRSMRRSPRDHRRMAVELY